MFLSHLSWKTLSADLLHLCTQFSPTISRRSQRWQCPECHTNASCHRDLAEHMKIHAKTAENYRVCPDCPVLLPQTCNLDDHRHRHHSGNEKYKCTEDPDCVWGGSTEDGLAHHRRKYHGKAAPNGDGIFNATPYESEPTVNPPPLLASSSDDLNSPVDATKKLTAGPFVSREAPDGQAQVVTRDEDVGFLLTSPGTSSKQDDPCYSPEAKQLIHASSPGVFDGDLDEIPSLGGALDGFDIEVAHIKVGPLGLMDDAMAAMNAINLLVSAEAPTGSYYGMAPRAHPRNSSPDGPNFGMV
ncbi:hypothetical protein IW261DRAFT_1593674 [Armillaria novae-zelandiae]|uniref:C2H2-type domain-containing protein n=1 Tax=Armillaria novae-zelandiae TaxID=153914 RepID=A0AA39TCD1_9AGAR|nr:hypothetical protein IW261DRAFT_1593674 [Armillaria novae-zelandiae]